MKRVKWIICALCILFPVFLLFICGVMLIGVSDESEDGDPVHASGLGLSDKVREYAAFVGDTAAEYNIHEYEKYLLAIMMVETGGEGNDPMQSLGNSGLTEEEKKEQQISVEQIVIGESTEEKKQEISQDYSTLRNELAQLLHITISCVEVKQKSR